MLALCAVGLAVTASLCQAQTTPPPLPANSTLTPLPPGLLQDWYSYWQVNIQGTFQWEYYTEIPSSSPPGLLSVDSATGINSGAGENLDWQIAPALNGLYWGYMATSDTAYVDMFVDLFNEVMEVNSVTNKLTTMAIEPDGYPGWPSEAAAGTSIDNLDSYFADSILGDAAVGIPVALMANQMISNPQLVNQYGATGQTYLTLVEKLYQKWVERGGWRPTYQQNYNASTQAWSSTSTPDGGAISVVLPYGINPTDTAWVGFTTRNNPGNGFSHPCNKANEMAMWLLALYDVTGNQACLSEAQKWFTEMKSRMTPSSITINSIVYPTFAIWNYWQPAGPWDYDAYGNPKEWIGPHPNNGYYQIDNQAIVDAYQHGIVFTSADITALTNTAKTSWTPSAGLGTTQYYFNPSSLVPGMSVSVALVDTADGYPQTICACLPNALTQQASAAWPDAQFWLGAPSSYTGTINGTIVSTTWNANTKTGSTVIQTTGPPSTQVTITTDANTELFLLRMWTALLPYDTDIQQQYEASEDTIQGNWDSWGAVEDSEYLTYHAELDGAWVGPTGSVQVTITPPAAAAAGAQWNVDGGPWQASGATLPGLSLDNHTVYFSTVPVWTPPAPLTVTVAANTTTSASGPYVEEYGSLKVTLAPPAAVTAGAQWNVDGGAWLSSGATATELTTGSHTVNYNTVTGWGSPPSAPVTITGNTTTTATGTYVLQSGGVQVTLLPAGALTAGARWNVNSGLWQSSGATVSNLIPGGYTINFKPVTGWTTPASQPVAVSVGSTTSATGTYVEEVGSLTVTLNPAGAAAAGAEWNVGVAAWHSSGATIGGLAVGNYKVNFKSITGWTSPASQTVTISNGQTTSATAAYFGAAANLAVTTQPPASSQADQGFGLAVTVCDSFGDTVQNSAAPVTLSLANANGATLGGTATAAAVNGVATFSGLTITKAGTGYALQATSGSLTAATSDTFAITPAGAAKLGFTTEPPASLAAGQAFTAAVAVLDADNNIVTSSTTSVSLALTNGNGATLSGMSPQTPIGGAATFSGLSITKAGTGYALQATATGLAPAVSSSFAITPGSAAQLAFTTQPAASYSAGQPISVAVSVEDASGNLVKTRAASVTLTLANANGATLNGTRTEATSGGVATFSASTITKAGTGYGLQAAASGLTGAISSAFAVTPAKAVKLEFTTQPPASLQAGQSFAPAVTALDTYNNIVTSSAGSVSLTLNNAGGAILSGATSLIPAGGVATFSGLSVNKSGPVYSLKATSGALAVTSSRFAVTPGSAAKLAFTSQPPATLQAGQLFVPRVAVQDADNNTVTSSGGTVSLTLTNANGATLSGTASKSLVRGVATFSSGLSVKKAGTGYALQATSGSFTAASGSFAITPSRAVKLVFSTQPPSPSIAGQPFGAAVTVLDAYSNIVTNSTASVSLALTNANGAALSGMTPRTPAQGVATFSSLSVNKAGTAYALKATSGLLTAAASGSFAITPADAAKLTFTTQPPASVKAGQLFAPAVKVLDAYNNTVTSSAASIGLTLNNANGATLNGMTPQTPAGGVATFSSLSVSKAGKGYALLAAAGGLTSAASNSFTVTAAATPADAATAPLATEAPAISGQSPAPDDWTAGRFAPILLHVTDAGPGADLTTLKVTASRDAGKTAETICDGSKTAADAAGATYYDASANAVFPGKTYIQGGAADYLLVFEPAAPYDYGETVTVSATAFDLAGNPIALGPLPPPSPQTAGSDPYSFTVAWRSFGCSVRSDGGTAADAFPAAATDGNGNTWAAWERPDATTGKGAIWVAERLNDGRNFGSEIQVTSGGDCHKPAIAIHKATGTIYVAYEVHDSTPPQIGVVTSGTATAMTTPWSSIGPVIMTGATFTLATAPAIEVTSDNRLLYVAGVGADTVVNPGVQQIGVGAGALASPPASGAATWAVTTLTDNANAALTQTGPAIAKDVNDIVYVVWANPVDNNLYGADSSSAWTPIHPVTWNTASAGSASPAIATEDGGNVLHFVCVATGATPNPDIQHAVTTGGWPATPLAWSSVLDTSGTGAPDAACPRIAVAGSTASGNAKAFVVWQDNRYGEPDIEFAETNYKGAFGTNILVSVAQPAAGHIYFAEAMDSCLYGSGSRTPVEFPPRVAPPAGPGPAILTDATNPHFTEVDIQVPADALNAPLNVAASELRNPVVECPGGSGIFTAGGSGLYLDITGAAEGVGGALNGWVTVTVHLAQPVNLPSPPAVYRLAPPANILDSWSWTTDWIRNASYDPGTNVLTFETQYLASFGVGSAAPAAAGGGGGG